MIRTFICIELSEDLREKVWNYLGLLRDIRTGVKWVEPKNLHLTLKFLGDISEDKVNSVVNVVEMFAKELKPFTLSFSRIGAFPDMKKPSVIWIGVTKGTDELSTLALNIDMQLSHKGFECEHKRFVPHLTIGRVKSFENLDVLKYYLYQKQETDFGEMKADTVTIMESRLYKSGPLYIPLEKVQLKD